MAKYSVGSRVTIERVTNDGLTSFSGEIVAAGENEYEIRPDGWTRAIPVYAYEVVPCREGNAIIQPKLNYKKK